MSQPPDNQPPDKQPADKPYLMDVQLTTAAIEALLLASETPIAPGRLPMLLPEASPDTIQRAIVELRTIFSGPSRGIHLVHVADGLQFRTNPAFAGQIRTMFQSKPVRLSRPAMETLAIIAYRQPITRAQIEEIRGVDSSGVVRTLMDHILIETVGRLDDIGKPWLYGTTRRFLEFFGLENIADLPTLEQNEVDALLQMQVHLDADLDRGEE